MSRFLQLELGHGVIRLMILTGSGHRSVCQTRCLTYDKVYTSQKLMEASVRKSSQICFCFAVN